MEINLIKGKAKELLGKYRYAVLILVLGIALMLLPESGTKQETPEPAQADSGELTVEQQLSQLLSRIQGAGEVEVMLSLASGAQTVYQTDTDTSDDGTKTSGRSDTVTVTDSDRNETGLIAQVNPPVYQGAVILCQGADNPAVRLAVVDAVSKYTGLGADKISVQKMK